MKLRARIRPNDLLVMSQLRGAKLIIGGDESSGIHDTSVTSREGNLMNNRPMRPIKRSSERVMLAMSICRISMRLDWRGIEFPQRLDDDLTTRAPAEWIEPSSGFTFSRSAPARSAKLHQTRAIP